ncbi:MAG: deoxyguanosinetriphosphate triphosphohydrolase [Planctomycetes bacterium RBG_16_43_13]|nr:MAG: deoxyguanosinetriphosphate triphosphohydrolase [Planctomycetes bacterium RBG_16_43_13]
MLTRQELERREDETLAPYSAKSGRSRGRKHKEDEHPYRTAFQRDRDRIVHSTAFRRLEYKTQVFVNHEGDYYRTRLTHSMEAAQIARTIARILNINEDLSETLALAHDLGHTPFGHAGEDALKEEMKNYGGFEHNIQGLRVVELLENKYPNFSGLNLTWETLESMRKHTVKPDFPVEPEYESHLQPLLECQVVDWADSIAYDAHDTDDSIKAGLISEDDIKDVALWQEAVEQVKKLYKKINADLLIKQAVLSIINFEVTDLVNNTEKDIKLLKINDVDDVRSQKQKVVTFSPDMERKKRELQNFLHKNVYRHYRVMRMSEKAKRFLKELFVEYVRRPEQMPPRFQTWAKDVGLERAVADYIAGMTDRYAQEEYQKLFQPFEKA